MPLFNAVKIYGNDVAPVLEPGERLLAMGMVHTHYSGDTSALESEGGDPHRPASSQGLVDGVDWTGVQYNQDRVNRAIGGSSGSGSAASWGGQAWQAIKARAVGNLDWAVTDRRLLLLDKDNANPPTFSVHFAVPREAIRSARRRGKILFQWGRVEVRFADDSMVAMVLAIVDVGAARNFVRALETGAARG
ncbi:hypothetical protein [Paractinoplanes atraurantiacus]|uniref:hypothetical protein n=1 Tax=Paractinoplanes atraurantiacus TaxID=1036182 RepID=UPI000BE46EF4|nr:hypothetical protein [Actinoplanes atraurantiacus]